MSTFQPEVLIQFDSEKYFPTDKVMQDQLKRSSLANLEGIWRKLDQVVESGPYFLGRDYSICDMLFIMQAIWEENQPSTFGHLPNIKHLMKAVLARPAVKSVLNIHQVEELAEVASAW
jgi:glutathione S-transferase